MKENEPKPAKNLVTDMVNDDEHYVFTGIWKGGDDDAIGNQMLDDLKAAGFQFQDGEPEGDEEGPNSPVRVTISGPKNSYRKLRPILNKYWRKIKAVGVNARSYE